MLACPCFLVGSHGNVADTFGNDDVKNAGIHLRPANKDVPIRIQVFYSKII